ncbi:TolC family outer membrane protein [Teredinibacter sp. KSP-S5-2]|uniref:TolC family outer membrane protein n=1 Tax=Teredinibacter sp. KSP-S5-2 TaxID=3034506 RepID=UPI002934DBB0|nr:TolC family outer membrane protein [Teredinibacter sp. KSP-S5-2]WNO10366.1 TolC family outer membrane protein [Teredinibacter sp. KSP-S5-2]
MKTCLGRCLLVLVVGVIPTICCSMTLEQVIAHTLETNPELQAAKNEKLSRIYEVKQARAGYLPSLSLDAGVGHETRTAPATDNQENDATRTELGLRASQTIFDGFSTHQEVQRQKARVESASFNEMATGEHLALKTAEAYLSVLRQAKLLDLARESLWEHQNIYDQMKLRKDTGVGSKADLDQIAARLALANSNMVVSQNNLIDAQSNFYRLVGLYPNLENMQKPDLLPVIPKNREEALALAVDGHPTLKVAAADVKAAVAQHKASKSAYWPRLNLEVDKRWDENIGTIEGEDEDFVVALRMSFDIYQGGKNRSKAKQTAYLLEEAKDIRNLSRRQVVESMSLSWNAYDALNTQLQYLQQHKNAAQSTKEAYAKQFNIGKRTLLDLLNTETEVVESKRAYTNAEYDLLFASYRILNAAGKLVNALQPK